MSRIPESYKQGQLDWLYLPGDHSYAFFAIPDETLEDPSFNPYKEFLLDYLLDGSNIQALKQIEQFVMGYVASLEEMIEEDGLAEKGHPPKVGFLRPVLMAILEKLDRDGLQELIAMAEARLAELEEELEPVQETSSNGSGKTGGAGWIELKTINGCGPYAYKRWRVGKTLRSQYLGKVKQEQQ